MLRMKKKGLSSSLGKSYGVLKEAGDGEGADATRNGSEN